MSYLSLTVPDSNKVYIVSASCLSASSRLSSNCPTSDVAAHTQCSISVTLLGYCTVFDVRAMPRYLIPFALRTSGLNGLEQGSDCCPVIQIAYTIIDLQDITKESPVEEIDVESLGLQESLQKVSFIPLFSIVSICFFLIFSSKLLICFAELKVFKH